jgi:hypothetical protein
MKQNRRLSILFSIVGEIALGLFFLATTSLFTTGGSGQEIKYGIGQWDPESGLGNHRAVVQVSTLPAPKAIPVKKGAKKAVAAPAMSKPAAVRVIIPWRRRDLDPEKKNIVVVDTASGERVMNVFALAVNREYGDFLFEPRAVPGDYFVPTSPRGGKTIPT